MPRSDFFVQEYPRGVWHVETHADPEVMLCGLRISINSDTIKIRRSFGLKPCLWCKRNLEEGLSSSPSFEPMLQSTKTRLDQALTPRLRLVTTSSGPDSRVSRSPGRASTDGGSRDGG